VVKCIKASYFFGTPVGQKKALNESKFFPVSRHNPYRVCPLMFVEVCLASLARQSTSKVLPTPIPI
jgi:hypothetical protein